MAKRDHNVTRFGLGEQTVLLAALVCLTGSAAVGQATSTNPSFSGERPTVFSADVPKFVWSANSNTVWIHCSG